MNRIIPHLWFDREARQAAEFYVSLFENSGIQNADILEGTPSGDVDTVSFTLAGQPFAAISAGPAFSLNESVSLMVACTAAAEVDRLWAALQQGGTVWMPLDTYPFSAHYGWIRDRLGVHWQIMLVAGEQPAQRIVPCLLFSGERTGAAEEAVRFYQTIFPGTSIELISHYAPGEAPSPLAKANYIGFTVQGMQMVAMDNAMAEGQDFNEAFSFMVPCDTQEEIDRYWAALSAVPEAEACGWLKDRYGVSWQIVPTLLDQLMSEGTQEQTRRVMEAFLAMKKFDIRQLQAAYQGGA